MNLKHDRGYERGLVHNIRNRQTGLLAKSIKAAMDHPECPIDLVLDLEKSKLATWIAVRLSKQHLKTEYDEQRER